jgi:hypothetical protein
LYRKWEKVTIALKQRDMDLATVEKTAIEDEQRRSTKEREGEGIEWQARFFYHNSSEDRWACRLRQ